MNDVFKKRLAALNDEQWAAVMYGEGPMLVIAGPGTGKTEMLALRAAYLVFEQAAVRPEEVLCLTFTEVAAENMRARLAGLMGAIGHRVPVYTFHGFASFLFSAYPEYFYGAAVFSAADEIMQIEVLEKIFQALPHGEPLRSEHPEQGFVYLKAARAAISHLKRAGIAPADFKEILTANAVGLAFIAPRMSIFDERVSMALVPKLREFAEACAGYRGNATHAYVPLPHAVAASLEVALDAAHELGKATPISAWKEKWTRKDDGGHRVLRDALYGEKLASLAERYAEYRAHMHGAGKYDFDDMVLDALLALRTNATLRHIVHERYAYALIDEFQDTNDAQMRLAEFLTENLIAVGDDDQAVYRFQGAELSNMLDFRARRPKCAVVSLVRNYRSRQGLIDAARSVIVQGEERLERRMEGLSKELIASFEASETGSVHAISCETPAHEAVWIATEIARLYAEGVKLSDVAVIGRRHADLDLIKAACAKVELPVAYERERDVLQDPVIRQVIMLARFASLLAERRNPEADDLLPDILSFPFWNLPRHTAWDVSVRSDSAHTPWLVTMRAHEEKAVRDAADALIALGVAARTLGVEEALDAVIALMRPVYWSRERLKADPYGYLACLSALRAFLRAVRAHRAGEFVTLKECVAFADLHAKNNLPIFDRSVVSTAMDAVRLTTAHGAKGLEFGVVFVIGCADRIWAAAGRGSLLPFPMNLPITPAGDGDDDRLRLLYVAMTRAKRALYLTSYTKTEGGKESLYARFLDHFEWVSADAPASPTIDDPLPLLSHRSAAPYVGEERALLSRHLEKYRLSVTHLNNFLNVVDAGPQVFFEQNLVRFPQAKSVSASYGSAMHDAMEKTSARLKETGALPTAPELFDFFTVALKHERLSPHDEARTLVRGEKALVAFLTARGDVFAPTDLVEVDFKPQNIVVSGAPLTGKIDRIVMGKDSFIEAHDWKTGKPSQSWEGGDVHERVKLYTYKNQLIFYKLILSHSPAFAGSYRMERGVLDYLEPLKDGRFVELALPITDADVERLTRLIAAVYKKIMALDFPDISKYPKTMDGITAFEEDLLLGTS